MDKSPLPPSPLRAAYLARAAGERRAVLLWRVGLLLALFAGWESAARLGLIDAFVVSSLNKETLEAIGLQDCDTVAVCIGEAIDTSILTTLTVLQLGIKKVISKAISFEHGTVLERLGAQVVYPERDMAVRVANRLLAPQMMEYISLSKEIDISEIRLTGVMEGRTVLELGLRREYGLNIIAINQNDTITTDIVPGLVLHADNSIVVVGRKENIRRFEAYLNN